MIALGSDCLLFRLANGERVPLSAEMISIEVMGDMAKWFDADFVQHAAKAVFHYFRQELGQECVTVSEFTAALERVLRGFKPPPPAPSPRPGGLAESDLCRLAREAGEGRELVFFPRLRAELRQRMRQDQGLLRFRGLRPCVMQLAGARRWTARCQTLEEQIVSYLRGCLTAEAGQTEYSLLVQ